MNWHIVIAVVVALALPNACSAYSLFAWSTKPVLVSTASRLYSTVLKELDVGEVEGTEFNQIESLAADLGKFRLKTTLDASDLNDVLDEYKGELKKRKFSFPGFRPGKIPPYAMGDVRNYIISFGLETVIGKLCNMNGLQLCNEDRSEVTFGSDDYYKQIIQDDANGNDFLTQRGEWREGNDITFTAEFFAEIDADAAESSESEDAAGYDEDIIDVSAVEVKDVDAGKSDEEA